MFFSRISWSAFIPYRVLIEGNATSSVFVSSEHRLGALHMDRHSHSARERSPPEVKAGDEENMFGNAEQEVHLKDLEGTLLDLQAEDSKSLDLARRTIMGKVLSNKALNKGAIKSVLMKLWGNPPNLHITDMGTNTYMFTFQEEKEAERILNSVPWSVMSHLMSTQVWDPQISVYEIDFNKVTFWVQLHGLPLELMTTSNVAKVAALLREVLEVENPKVDGKLLRSFFRTKVC